MIERFPEGTPEIPYPHKLFRWRDGSVTLTVEVNPHTRGNPPKIAGWAPFFSGFHGYEKPMTYSYKPVPAPSRPEHRRNVQRHANLVYNIGTIIEDRGGLSEAQLDELWAYLDNSTDAVYELVGPVIDGIEDAILREVAPV